MSFGSLIPLIILVGVPIIIILYLMRPKGVRKVVPSVLLWKNTDRNERSTTFSKKFIRNILMFLEILALLFLMFAAMSPAIKRGVSGSTKSAILVIDTTGSMKMENRFQEAIADAKDFVDTSSGDISIITCGSSAEVLANSSKDKQKLKRILSDIKPTDTAGDISKSEGLIKSLDKETVVVFTDNNGAAKLSQMANNFSIDINVYGEFTANVGLTQMSMKKNNEGNYDIAVGYQTKGTDIAQFDISIYDAENNLLDVRSVSVSGDNSNTILSLNRNIKGEYIRAELAGFKKDSLTADNVAYAVKNESSEYTAYFVGAGNTFYEKAYMAISGDTLVKVSSDNKLPEGERCAVFYDDANLVNKNVTRFVQKASDTAGEQVSGAIITVRTKDFISDMADYTFGASSINTLECPEWGTPLMVINADTENERVVAYYGENEGVRQVVLGFDIRDSEFPLMAEFPIFIADSLSYLTDDSLVKSKYIQAGETVDLSPSVSSEIKLTTEDGKEADTRQSGLYKLTDGDKVEYFVSRFPISEGDGSADIESMSHVTEGDYGIRFGSLKRVCLVLALILIVLDWIIYMRRRVKLRKPELVWRIVLTLLIILSIIGVYLPGRKGKTATIFVVDMSDSNIANLQSEEEYIKKQIDHLPHGESYGIVTFGRNVMTEQFIKSDAEYLGIATKPDGGATDIEGAVDYAASLIPENKMGRIVLLTDGKETLGDVSGTKGKLDENDIELCSMLFDTEYGQDVYLQNVDMPERLAEGDAYSIKITVYSTYETSAKLKLWDGSELLDEMSINLTKGTNTFVMNEVAGDAAIERRNVTVEAGGDSVQENNNMVAASMVEAPKKTLIISGLREDSAGIENLIRSLNKDVTVVSVLNAPTDITELMKYQTVILDSCHITDMPENLPELLQVYVKDYGGGIICTGGKESYAPGGYTDTPIEELLPVEMLPKSVDEAPSLAMVMVIDCSGSMDSAGYDPVSGKSVGRSKIDVAVDAAKEAVDNLGKNDFVGVLTFSDDFKWRQRIVRVSDPDAIKEEIEKIGIMGGTVIKPAVIEAANALKKTDAGVKHILLLTDGEGETKNFDDAIDLLLDNGITMSTIAVGSDSDTKLLEELAEECGGRYYYSDSSSDVPKIFAEEVYLSGETYFRNGDFSLSVRNSDLVRDLYKDGIPNISGYIATTTKQGAREIITTSEDDPLLASWQYGLGHSVAWMTSASSDWNQQLAGANDYPEMWKRMLDYATMESDIGQDNLSIYKRRGKIEVSYTASEFSEDTEVVGVYTAPSGETEELSLEPGDPGVYSASFEPEEMGVYSISVRRNEKGETVAATTAVETVQFSDEYRRDISNANFVSFVSGNGRILDGDTKLFTKIKSSKSHRRDITDLVIILSVIMLLLDVVIRRFDLYRLFTVKKNAGKSKSVSGRAVDNDKAAERVKAPQMQTESGSDIKSSTTIVKDAGRQEIEHDDKMDSGVNNEASTNGLDVATLLKKKRDRNL